MIEWRGYRAALDQDFALECDAIIGPLASTWVVTQGLRKKSEQVRDALGALSFTEQAALYQKGRTPFATLADLMASDPKASIIEPLLVVTEAKPLHSPHEWGLAIDVALLKFDNTLSWDTSFPAWPELWEAIRKSPGLHSGHDFPPIAPADDDHVEAYRWAYSVNGAPSKRTELEDSGQW